MAQLVSKKDEVTSPWSQSAQLFEYTSAVNPTLAPVPILSYPRKLHMEGPTRIIPFDLSESLAITGPACAPNLFASYIRIRATEQIEARANASAHLYYVIRGKGKTDTSYGAISWSEGDVFTLPACEDVSHTAIADTALYWVNDSPLLNYLGVEPVKKRFTPTYYSKESIVDGIKEVDKQADAKRRNRNAVILGNERIEGPISATHTLWGAVVFVDIGQIQRPHRHNSTAVDIVVAAAPGAYSLLGKQVDLEGNIVNAKRVDWEAGTAFITPPGLWHGHYNESGQPAIVMAVQDAGFHEYMRTLDITFSKGGLTGE